MVPPGLAREVDIQALAGQGPDPRDPIAWPPWELYPPYLEFSFTGYVRSDTRVIPQLLVYPVADYERLNEAAAEIIQETRQALAGRPAVPQHPPILPIFNANQVIRAQFQYVDFANGTGLRFIAQYAQNIGPINNSRLFYTFQGITADGAYYVAAILPVSAPVLPDNSDAPTPPEGVAFPGYDQPDLFDDYLADVTEVLNNLPADQYSPSLETLDILMKSVTVKALTAAGECPSELSSALPPASMAYVSLNPPVSNRLRAAPGLAASLVGSLPSGSVVDLIAGPLCADGLIWWQVVVSGGPQNRLAGWTAEGSATEKWLVACPAGATCPP